jgi:hypothetical protein
MLKYFPTFAVRLKKRTFFLLKRKVNADVAQLARAADL